MSDLLTKQSLSEKSLNKKGLFKNMRFFTRKILPLLIVILGALLSYYILHAGQQEPVNYKNKQKNRLRLVQTTELIKASVVPTWHASGFVIPAESVKVHARVSGNIESINPLAIPGGQLQKGQWLAKLEALDFELALDSQQALLAQAQANLSLVQADQLLAKEELLLLNSDDGLAIDQSLVLREPQLTVAKAKISVAKSNVEKAQLNLDRTRVLMPFDGKIISKTAGLGSKVSSNSSLFSIVNTETYWLEVKIPHRFLSLLDKQALADISQIRLWGEGKTRTARFVSVLPELDSKDRQVKLLLAIDDPQIEHSMLPQVFINDFLNIKLKGKAINDAWTIKHSWLQADNTIWVVDKNSTLQKRAVEVLFKGQDLIYVNADIKSGDSALAEKPVIASIGLPVRSKKSLSNSIAMSKSKQMNKLKAQESVNKKQGLSYDN